MNELAAAIFTHCYTADILKVSEGGQNMPSPNMSLWHKNYFEFKIIEKQ